MASSKSNKPLVTPAPVREVTTAQGCVVLQQFRGTVQRDGLVVVQRNLALKVSQTPPRPFMEKTPWEAYVGRWETKIVSRLTEGQYKGLPVGVWFPNVRVVKVDGRWAIVIPPIPFENLAKEPVQDLDEIVQPIPEAVAEPKKARKPRRSRKKTEVSPVAEELAAIPVFSPVLESQALEERLLEHDLMYGDDIPGHDEPD